MQSIVEKDFYNNEIIANALTSRHGNTDADKYARLTTREVEILLLICQELAPGEISERLQISEKTFFNHRANILVKTKASSVGLIRYSISNGYFEI